MKSFKEFLSEQKRKQAYIQGKNGKFHVIDIRGNRVKTLNDLRTATHYLNTHKKELNASASIAKPTIDAIAPTIGGAPTMAG